MIEEFSHRLRFVGLKVNQLFTLLSLSFDEKLLMLELAILDNSKRVMSLQDIKVFLFGFILMKGQTRVQIPPFVFLLDTVKGHVRIEGPKLSIF